MSSSIIPVTVCSRLRLELRSARQRRIRSLTMVLAGWLSRSRNSEVSSRTSRTGSLNCSSCSLSVLFSPCSCSSGANRRSTRVTLSHVPSSSACSRSGLEDARFRMASSMLGPGSPSTLRRSSLCGRSSAVNCGLVRGQVSRRLPGSCCRLISRSNERPGAEAGAAGGVESTTDASGWGVSVGASRALLDSLSDQLEGKLVRSSASRPAARRSRFSDSAARGQRSSSTVSKAR